MISQERKAFADLREFREYARNAARVVYYHVFRGVPDRRMIDALAGCGPDEALVLLDIDEDRGFLTTTDVTVDITPGREFIARKLAECPGLGAWSRGTPLKFVALPGEVQGLIAYARRFAFPAERPASLTHADSK